LANFSLASFTHPNDRIAVKLPDAETAKQRQVGPKPPLGQRYLKGGLIPEMDEKHRTTSSAFHLLSCADHLDTRELIVTNTWLSVFPKGGL
jgi:hypothetical protein